ncbi:hypothetical protein [Sphingomonas xinjiangensis]|uniref:Uncharacterized protein n=1 Tax=Sphingomonas xinjiangensis TaxID=643568 RepID=A0A840YNR0_9SPHN|nr:hypothetical protein [Sphingomonas xinjiangensis]MBB5709551.1 hypothetical protein [Sphingomonas xinjiangensis]
MIRVPVIAFCCAASLAVPSVSLGNPLQNLVTGSTALPSYSSSARQVLAAPLIIDARVRDAVRIKGAEAADVQPGRARFYLVVEVLALIRGTESVPLRLGYVADVALDARGKAPKLKKQRVLLFARPLPTRADHIQLIDPDGQRPWSPELDSLVRGITREVVAANAPPAVKGVGNAFHVPGSLPGEGETQIFLQTATNVPVSLQVLRRPGEQPRWSVSLGDIVDETGGPVRPDTLLWYHLACGLPRELPVGSIDSADATNAQIAREDYQLVLQSLGPCR